MSVDVRQAREAFEATEPVALTRPMIDNIKQQMSEAYSRQLAERVTFSAAEKTAMYMGFRDGLSWMLKTLEVAGLKIEEGA